MRGLSQTTSTIETYGKNLRKMKMPIGLIIFLTILGISILVALGFAVSAISEVM